MKPLVLLTLVLATATAHAAPTTTAPATQPALITLTSPHDYQIFQGGNDNTADVVVSGHVDPTSHITTVTYLFNHRVGRSEKSTIVAVDADGNFSSTSHRQAGDWRELSVNGFDKTDHLVGSFTVAHVAVGEVFLVGGQSNSTNYGEVKQKTQTNLVSVFDGTTWSLAADPLPGVDGKGGSPWCIFGDLLAQKLHVPIGIIPVGKGATSVRQWLPPGDIITIEPSRTYGLTKLPDGTFRSEGQLFTRMTDRMKQLGPHGFRAMLWHQGESDAHQQGNHTLPGDQYRANLSRIITESRKSASWEVPWFIAQASYGPGTGPSDDIRSAQKSLWENHTALQGPDTDTLLNENRQNNGKGIHMSDLGLHAHAQLWADIITNWLNTQPTTAP